MSRIKPPQIPAQILPHYDAGEVEAMLRACDHSTLAGARDRAIILMLFDTGVRGGELVGLNLADLDLSRGTVLVRGKDGRERVVSIGSRTGLALNRYLRTLQRREALPPHGGVWVGQGADRLTFDGLRMLLQRRAQKARVCFRESMHSGERRLSRPGRLAAIPTICRLSWAGQAARCFGTTRRLQQRRGRLPLTSG